MKPYLTLILIFISGLLYAQQDPCTASALATGATLSSQTLTNSDVVADQTDCTVAPDPRNCINGSAYGGWDRTGICEDLWYAVTVPAGSNGVIVNLDSGGGDLTAAIYSTAGNTAVGSCTEPLTQITCDGDGAGLDPIVAAYDLAAGDVVYVRVWEFNCNTNATFDISATAVSSSTGEDLSNPAILTVGGATLTGQSITDSNNLEDETYGVVAPNTCGQQAQFYTGIDPCEDLWYEITVPGTPGSGPVEITVDAVFQSGSDHIMAIYKNSPSGSGNLSPMNYITCEDDGTNGTVSITVDCAVPGEVLYARVWNFDCDGATTFDISASGGTAATFGTSLILDECSDGNTYTLATCGTDASPGLTLQDSGAGGNYGNDEDYTITICKPAGASDCLRAEFISFDLEDGTVGTLSASNDYLYVYDGADASAPLVSAYTGNEVSNGRPGNIYSTSDCLTFRFQTNGAEVGTGFEIEFECVGCQNPQTSAGGQTVTCGTPVSFTDTGGAGGSYGNYEHNVWTYCPSDASQCIWAEFTSFATQEDVDYLYVYDGNNATTAPLMGIFGGLGNLDMRTLKSTVDNASGCLTFKFVSSAGVTAAGWEASIDCGECRFSTSSDNCSNATMLTQNGTYAGWNVGRTGDPACEDPNLDIPCFLDDNTTSSPITELELTTWYHFTVPMDVCLEDFQIALQNVACQDATGLFGLQFAVIPDVSGNAECLWGPEWEDPILCYDRFVEGSPVGLHEASMDQGGPGLVPGDSYFIFTDAFNGSSCNWDLVINNLEAPEITYSTVNSTTDVCTGEEATFEVTTTAEVEFVYSTTAITDPYTLAGATATPTSGSLGETSNYDVNTNIASLSATLPANTTCAAITYNICAIRADFSATDMSSQCRPSDCGTVTVYPIPQATAPSGCSLEATSTCTSGIVIEYSADGSTGWTTTTPTPTDGAATYWRVYVSGLPTSLIPTDPSDDMDTSDATGCGTVGFSTASSCVVCEADNGAIQISVN